MGLMDLSTSASSKKRVDFNDARYQLAGKLKQNLKANVRSTFTLYDNKEYNKTAVHDISAAYALSDKKLPIGELLNKMVDLIVDMEDGIVNTQKDPVYAWKYSVVLLDMYEDKCKRQETLSIFDNGLKNSVINSQSFIKRYPGKYTSRTNFFDPKVKTALTADIVDTFKDVALPDVHKAAIKTSRERAEKHSNPTMDRIVQWAITNYGCTADSFFEVKEDEKTHLYYSTNTVILHLKNGYDMSIIGYVGTDHDDKFAISIFDANSISIKKHGEKFSSGDLQNVLAEVAQDDPIDPLTKLLALEKKKNVILRKQYDILSEIRPMIPAEVLDIKAAESVVGETYIWGCRQFRAEHEDLPVDFKLEDVKLPELEETKITNEEIKRQNELLSNINDMTSVFSAGENKEKDTEIPGKYIEPVMGTESAMESPNVECVESVKVEDVEKIEVESIVPSSEIKTEVEFETDMKFETQCETTYSHENENDGNETDNDNGSIELEEIKEMTDDIFQTATISDAEDLFDVSPKKKVEEKKAFEKPAEFALPTLVISQVSEPKREEKKPEVEFDTSLTLLPGVIPMKKKETEENIGPSVTQQAQPAPEFKETSLWKDEPEAAKKPVEKPKKETEEIEQPELILDNIDDIDSLFE